LAVSDEEDHQREEESVGRRREVWFDDSSGVDEEILDAE
jgi:hypothetical protein